MNQEDKQYFDNFFDLFQHPGWKQFIDNCQEVEDSINYDNCKNYEDFLATKAAREQLRRILAFEAMMQQSYDNILEDTDDSVPV